jgi:hypothetical protein
LLCLAVLVPDTLKIRATKKRKKAEKKGHPDLTGVGVRLVSRLFAEFHFWNAAYIKWELL